MKKAITILFAIIFFSTYLKGQTCYITHVSGDTGTYVHAPIIATDLINVGAITLYIGFDSLYLTFAGITNVHPDLSGLQAALYGSNQVNIGWFSLAGKSFSNDTLLELKFMLHDYYSDLTFNPGCEFANTNLPPVVIPVTFTDGSIASSDVILSAHTFLEGPYTGSMMDTSLNEGLLLPLNQPYNMSPWNYAGTESVSSIPDGVVDWVLLEFRDAPEADFAFSSTMIGRKAALLHYNGLITDIDGSKYPVFDITPNDHLYLVVYHRNHLSVMSADSVFKNGPTYPYDFTTALSKAYLDGQKDLTGGFFGMYAGDADSNGDIIGSDQTFWTNDNGQSGVYYNTDFNLDSEVIGDDQTIWTGNNGTSTQVPN